MFQKDEAGIRLIPVRLGTTLTGAGQKPRLVINARPESLLSNSRFRQAMQNRRCIIPFDGFYEWPKIGRPEDSLVKVHLGHLVDKGFMMLRGQKRGAWYQLV